MSISITIDNNIEHVDANCPDKRQENDTSCQCTTVNSLADENCHNCNGTGVDPLLAQLPWSYPFELNLSNKNFNTVWSALGLPIDLCKIHPYEFIKVLDSTRTELMVRSTKEVSNEKNEYHFDFGINDERIDWYMSSLYEIADEAARREEFVIWG